MKVLHSPSCLEDSPLRKKVTIGVGSKGWERGRQSLRGEMQLPVTEILPHCFEGKIGPHIISVTVKVGLS